MLKPETQAFLESLDEEDILRIKNALKVYSTVETLSRAGKYIAFSFLATVILISQFGDSVLKIKLWFK